jgi:hypothetical protein
MIKAEVRHDRLLELSIEAFERKARREPELWGFRFWYLTDYATLDELGFTIHLVKENQIIGPNSKSSEQFVHGIEVLVARNYRILEMFERFATGRYSIKALVNQLNGEGLKLRGRKLYSNVVHQILEAVAGRSSREQNAEGEARFRVYGFNPLRSL